MDSIIDLVLSSYLNLLFSLPWSALPCPAQGDSPKSEL